MKVTSAKESRRLDEFAVAEYGIPQIVLMENAALASFRTAERLWGVHARKVLVVCGSGSNGGDGCALARLLHAGCADTTVLMAGDPGKMRGGAAENYAILQNLPVEIIRMEASPNPSQLRILTVETWDFIVDALLGIGLSRPLEGSYEALVTAINQTGLPVLALDIPSGIDSDTGEELGSAVRAAATVTFGLPKRGNLFHPGRELCGLLHHSRISLPPEILEDSSLDLSADPTPPLPQPAAAGHKGRFGSVAVIGGSEHYCGAPSLASAAALKGGAGYVHSIVPQQLGNAVYALAPEAVIHGMSGPSLGSEHAETIMELCSAADAVVLGPGLSREPESIRLARRLITDLEKPLIIDGDAIFALGGREELCTDREHATILTPHPGEMAKLLGSSIREVQARRVETVREAANRFNAVCVLKGASSLIALPDGHCWINLTGNPGMGTAGAGDILAGLAGAFVAAAEVDHRYGTGQSRVECVRQAVHYHGMAGDLAAEELGIRGTTAGDILRRLPYALREGERASGSNPYEAYIRSV